MAEESHAAPTHPDVPRAPEPAESYRFRVGEFDGPLDLLLHLVRINEVSITDIPIVEITRQYNEYLDLMRELDLEIAGEYLVMAATLMHIKSRMLLPAEPATLEEEREDPRAELARQLLEYQRFKQAAETLQAIDSVQGLIWTREGKVPAEFAGEELLIVELFDIIGAFHKLLGRLDEETRLRIHREDVSVADKIAWLSEILEQRDSIRLQELFEWIPDRIHRIAAFLALLEMMRLRLVLAFQRRRLDDIWIARRPDAEPGAALGTAAGEAAASPDTEAPE